MKRKPAGVLVLALALSALACTCNLLSSLPGGSSALFEDDFSGKGNGWDENTGLNGATNYGDGDYVIQVFSTSYFIWANPEGANLSLSNVHIEVTARSTGSATEPGFGILCDYGDGDNTYYMGVSTDGYYIIVKTVNGEDVPLSDPDSWITSDAIPVNAASYRIGADCGNGTLALSVNGNSVGSVSDSTFTSGTIGLFARSFEQPNAEIRFDDLVVTALP